MEESNNGAHISCCEICSEGEVYATPALNNYMAEDSRFLTKKAAEKRGVISVHPDHYGSASQGCWELAVKM